MKQLILFSGILAGLAMAGTTVSAATADTTPAPTQDKQNKNTTASVKIDQTDGELTIDSAPSFDFGTVKALEIYNSFDRDSVKITKPLTVVDGRSQDIKEGWHLSATLSAFNNNGKDSLNAAKLTLGSKDTAPAGMDLNGQLETGKTTTVMSHDTDRGTLTLPEDAITAHLHQDATPNAAVTKNTTYTAELTWTLTSGIQAKSL